MSTTESDAETPTAPRKTSKARMPYRYAAGVLAILCPLGLIPVAVELSEGVGLVALAPIAAAVLVCTFMFARTALTGRTPMYTSTMITLLDDPLGTPTDD